MKFELSTLPDKVNTLDPFISRKTLNFIMGRIIKRMRPGTPPPGFD
jgi:hypothetical protein